jgi:hypothetical protein
MSETVEKIADQVKQLPRRELDELLTWLADYEASQTDDWDREIEEDAQPGGRLEEVLQRVRADIAQGRTKPLDQILDNP